ncbi:MAG: FAD-binding protein, partial [Saprospiraceae bacterium]|nr:FAD-binding protein [Saprospiraceae bacterium]
PGNSLPRFHMVWGTGWELTYVMIRHLKQHKNHHLVDYRFDHRVTDLEQVNGRITGLRGHIETSNEPFYATAEHIVIATGGINGSIERIKENWYKPLGVPPETILNGAHEYAIGDLHDATSSVNGNVVNLDKQWNYVAGIRHYKPRKPEHGLSIVPGKSQLWLNYEGRRFGPVPLMSPFDTSYLLERICQEPLKYSWQLLNQKIANKEFAISGSEHNHAMRDKKFFKFVWTTLVKGQKNLIDFISRECEDVITALSIEELVDKMNALTGEKHVKLNYVREAAQKYDEQIDRGPKFHNDEQLRRIAYVRQYRGDRARTCKFQKILEPSAFPLIAIRSFILSRKSLGGIQTDLRCRVLSKPGIDGSQRPIEGLYAIGEAAGFGGGGIHGRRSLEGTFLGGCVITARVCAAAIAGKTL